MKFPLKPEKKHRTEPGPDEEQPGDNEQGSSGDGISDDFFRSIESLALRQNDHIRDFYQGRSGDLADISADDYPETETTEKTLRKIDELQSIIESIERKYAIPAEV